jgi:hypothetical protein
MTIKHEIRKYLAMSVIDLWIQQKCLFNTVPVQRRTCGQRRKGNRVEKAIL